MKNLRLSCLALLAMLTIAYSSCKPNDADIQTAVNDKLKENASLAGISASVADGIVTLTGNCEAAGCDAAAADAVKPVQGVKEVKNNISVTPPAPVAAPVEITPDDPLKAAVNNVISGHKDVTATVNDGVVTLTGKIKRADLQDLMMKLNELKPRKIENQLTIE